MSPAGAARIAAPVRGASVATGALAWLAYLAMTPSVSGDKDGSEFTLVLATLGTAHPTGYPLYTMLGHAFARVAHGLGASWPFAANAFSGLGGGVAIGLLHALSARLLRAAGLGAGGAAAVAALPAVAFGMNPAWTQETCLAEVYSWHVAWAVGASLFVLGAMQAIAAASAARSEPQASEVHEAGPRAPISRIAALGGLLAGLGLTHHLTSVFLLLPLGLALLLVLKRTGLLGFRVLAIGLGGFAVGISSLAYLFWRASHPGAVQWPMLGPDTVWQHLLGGQYGSYLGGFAPIPLQQKLLAQHVYPWLAPGLLALLAAPFSRWPAVPREWRFALAVAGVLQTASVFAYGVPDPSAYFLAVLALGLAVLPAWLAEVLPMLRRRGAWLAGGAALVLAVASAVWFRIGYERIGFYERFDGTLHQLWRRVPFDEGFVVFGDDLVYRLWEYQLLGGEKPRVIALNPALLTYPRYHEAFLARHGFDPLAEPPYLPPVVDAASKRAWYKAVTDRINYRSPLPVVRFDPARESIWSLPKR